MTQMHYLAQMNGGDQRTDMHACSRGPSRKALQSLDSNSNQNSIQTPFDPLFVFVVLSGEKKTGSYPVARQVYFFPAIGRLSSGRLGK